MKREGERERENLTLMTGAGLVVLTSAGVRQRSDFDGAAFRLRSRHSSPFVLHRKHAHVLGELYALCCLPIKSGFRE